jgi:hypothetical protein
MMTLFVTAENWKQHKYPPMIEWTNMLLYISTEGSPSALKINYATCDSTSGTQEDHVSGKVEH